MRLLKQALGLLVSLALACPGAFAHYTVTPVVNGGTGATTFSGAGLVQFGGNGADAAVTVSSTPTGLNKTYYATTFTTSGTFNLGCGNCIINTTSTLTMASGCTYRTSIVASTGGGFLGGNAEAIASSNGEDGWGPGAGRGGGTDIVIGTPDGGGGGASIYVAGGTGGRANASAPSTAGQTTSTKGTAGMYYGSGGGSGGTGSGGSSTAAGAGGGCVRMYAVGALDLSAATAVQAGGVVGGNGATLAGGSGGGGGGSVWCFSQTSCALGTTIIDVSGGAGGNGAGTGGEGGGGGGGGYVLQMSPGTNSGTITSGGGAGGSGTVSGTAGGSGTLAMYSQTPTLPTIGFCEDVRGVVAQAKLKQATLAIHGKPTDHLHFTQHEGVTWLAAWYAKPGQFDNLCYLLNNGGSLQKAAALSCVDVSRSFNNCAIDTACMAAFPPEQMEQTAKDTCDSEALDNAA